MIQILHFADLHLDTSFAHDGFPPNVGTWRRADLRATLGRILTLARERRVDVVTIGGDLFDQNYISPDLADFLKQQFSRLSPIKVYITPGQQDPYTNDSLYALTEWPENVTVFSQGKLAAVEVEPNIHLWGAAHPLLREHQRLTNIRVKHQGLNLLLLHAVNVDQKPEHDNASFLLDSTTLQAVGFDFALLGGQHKGRLWPDDIPFCVYPGSPEPLSFDEAAGSHQVVLLTIEDNRCTPELIPINLWRYETVTIDLTGCESVNEASQIVEKRLGTDNLNDERLIVKGALTGLPEILVDIEALAEAIEAKAHLKYECCFSLEDNLEQLSHELTVRGLLVRRLQDRIAKAQSKQQRHDLLNVLNMAIRALDGREVPLSYEVVIE